MTHSGKKTDLVFLLQSISSLCYLTDVLLCSCFIVHDHDLLPNMTSNWIFNMSNITDATNGAKTASPYSAPKFTGWFVWGSYGSMLIFLWSILLTIICIFSFFWPLYYLSFNFPFLITPFWHFQTFLPVCFRCLIIETLIIFFLYLLFVIFTSLYN
jgi:hypothetical protein